MIRGNRKQYFAAHPQDRPANQNFGHDFTDEDDLHQRIEDADWKDWAEEMEDLKHNDNEIDW